MRVGAALHRLALRLEAPTWVLAVMIYGSWLALTFWWNRLPLLVVLPLAAWICAWQMSLQHELMHGHPTRNERINTALASPPLNLWLPYSLYREQHLRHHRHAYLTDPLEDPESTYLSPEAWRAAPPWRRQLHTACNTTVGRLLLGPLLAITLFWIAQFRLVGRPLARWRVWLGHAAGVAGVMVWVVGVCRIEVLAYLLCFVYPGTALIMIRSLAEHQAADDPADRTAVVERAGLLGLLFLHNNLHALHHERPGLPWYTLPAAWRVSRSRLIAGRSIPIYRGYFDVATRYAVRPHHPGPHPLPFDSTVEADGDVVMTHHSRAAARL
ncbi:fatty acid desaturase [Lichenicola sp.]|uniref:fatty acid desaturase n=1 Tax=Lichenicola sp. TaxID=2804529 RepID=UPI003AFF8DB4